MKQKLIIGIIVVVIIAGAIWAMMSKKPAPTDSPINTNTENTNMMKDEKARSLKALMASNTPQECTFQSSTDSSRSEGKVYLSNGMMRGDFTAVSSGQTFTSHMITKDGTVYTWIDNMNTGFKASVDASAQADTDNSKNQNVDINAEHDFNCNAWSANSNMFVLPVNITFTDINAMIPQRMNNADGTPNTQADCSACDQIPDGPSREQCKTALGCK